MMSILWNRILIFIKSIIIIEIIIADIQNYYREVLFLRSEINAEILLKVSYIINILSRIHIGASTIFI